MGAGTPGPRGIMPGGPRLWPGGGIPMLEWVRLDRIAPFIGGR